MRVEPREHSGQRVTGSGKPRDACSSGKVLTCDSEQDQNNEQAGEAMPLDPQFDKVYEELFMRYDLDGSGTINSKEEFQMLTTNMAFKLDLQANIDKVSTDIDMVDFTCSYDQQGYRSWFAKHCGRWT